MVACRRTGGDEIDSSAEADYYAGQRRVWKLDRKGRFDGTVKDREQVRGKNSFELRVRGKVKGSKVKGKIAYKSELATRSCKFPQRRCSAKYTGKDEYGRGPSPGGPGPR